MTGAERAKLSRIRAKPAEKRTPEDLVWHSELEASYGESMPLDGWQDASTVAPVAPVAPPRPDAGTTPDAGTGRAAGEDEIWDRVIDTTTADDDESGEHEIVVAPAPEGARQPDGEAVGPALPDKSAPMSLDVARGTAASYFLLQSSAWSMIGDRDPRYLEPTDEERRLLTKVFASYAERYGWTKELDDAILLGTVLLVSNARAFRAPRKPAKSPAK